MYIIFLFFITHVGVEYGELFHLYSVFSLAFGS